MKSYILRQDFQHQHSSAFQQYVIHNLYGDDILLGSDLMNEDVVVDESEDEENE